jgi:hypothetical protein
VRNICKAFALFAVIVVVNGLVAISTVHAQVGVTTPVTPGFDAQYQQRSYYMSPTYGVDPATGKAVMTHEGYYKIDRQVEVSIVNQPFETYTDSNGNPIDLYFDIQWKNHNAASWETLLPANSRLNQNKDFYLTAIDIGFKDGAGHSSWNIDVLDYVPGSQVDFQVQASIGYYTTDNVFVGKSSGWSNTHTLTIPDDNSTSIPSTSPTSTVSPSQNPTVTPQQVDVGGGVLLGLDFEQTALILLSVAVAVLLVVVVVFLRSRRVKSVV